MEKAGAGVMYATNVHMMHVLGLKKTMMTIFSVTFVFQLPEKGCVFKRHDGNTASWSIAWRIAKNVHYRISVRKNFDLDRVSTTLNDSNPQHRIVLLQVDAFPGAVHLVLEIDPAALSRRTASSSARTESCRAVILLAATFSTKGSGATLGREMFNVVERRARGAALFICVAKAHLTSQRTNLSSAETASRSCGELSDPFFEILLKQLFPKSTGRNPLFLICAGSRGGTVDRLLASHLGEPSSIPGGLIPELSHVGILPDDAADRRVFSGFSSPPLPPPALTFRRSSTFTSFVLSGSRDLDGFLTSPGFMHEVLAGSCLGFEPRVPRILDRWRTNRLRHRRSARSKPDGRHEANLKDVTVWGGKSSSPAVSGRLRPTLTNQEWAAAAAERPALQTSRNFDDQGSMLTSRQHARDTSTVRGRTLACWKMEMSSSTRKYVDFTTTCQRYQYCERPDISLLENGDVELHQERYQYCERPDISLLEKWRCRAPPGRGVHVIAESLRRIVAPSGFLQSSSVRSVDHDAGQDIPSLIINRRLHRDRTMIRHSTPLAVSSQAVMICIPSRRSHVLSDAKFVMVGVVKDAATTYPALLAAWIWHWWTQTQEALRWLTGTNPVLRLAGELSIGLGRAGRLKTRNSQLYCNLQPHTRQQNDVTDQQNVGTPFVCQCVIIHTPDGSPDNRVPYSATAQGPFSEPLPANQAVVTPTSKELPRHSVTACLSTL
ncbi:hypothetical protein PR048_017719 [Dryococelus australis]|uniref:Uncharacterized protein n=1 Tax=Dryococelus australis TaxID=614101 RepID=A0ABQ9HAW2_9NEOP|nr:hypothetical protein PR048_017719 [Dryococelus australis]